jgi:hypothetical protein
MRAKDVVGKKIVRVRQQRIPASNGLGGDWSINALELEDGTRIVFDARELENEGPYPTATIFKKETP